MYLPNLIATAACSEDQCHLNTERFLYCKQNRSTNDHARDSMRSWRDFVGEIAHEGMQFYCNLKNLLIFVGADWAFHPAEIAAFFYLPPRRIHSLTILNGSLSRGKS